MSSLELMAIDVLGRSWSLILAFTAAVLVVVALRKPCRQLFGAERAFQLWSLAPLAILASQLPHGTAAPVMALPAVVLTITSAAAALPSNAGGAAGIDWRACAVLLWLVGIIATLALAVLAQSRYRARLRGATRVSDLASRWPVLRAIGADVGPALVGAWRARIVLPADFELRYDAAERELVLAHEAMHARRADGWWCLLAQAVVALFWFHPLAWWALSALRHDQELACDAAVLREHGAQRRSYANAMLKTQSAAFALPVGCPWSPRHPITERIAMLKQKQPDAFRRRAGGLLVACFVAGVASAVYATAPPTQIKNHSGMADHYTLKIDVAIGGNPASRHFTRCVKSNEYASVSGSDSDKLSWQGRFAVLPVAKGQLEIRAQIDARFERTGGVVRTLSGHPFVRTMPGQLATIVVGQIVDGKHLEKLEDNTVKIQLTASPGCDDGSLAAGDDQPERPASEVASDLSRAREYQFNMSVELEADDAARRHTEHAALALCTALGKTATVSTHAWRIDATALPEEGGRLGIDLTVFGPGNEQLARTRLHGALGDILHPDGESPDRKHRYAIEVTPLAGCPARATAGARETLHT